MTFYFFIFLELFIITILFFFQCNSTVIARIEADVYQNDLVNNDVLQMIWFF